MTDNKENNHHHSHTKISPKNGPHSEIVSTNPKKEHAHEGGDLEAWRRACGCVKTSEKLRRIISSFPTPPPPTPMRQVSAIPIKQTQPYDESAMYCLAAQCQHARAYRASVVPRFPYTCDVANSECCTQPEKLENFKFEQEDYKMGEKEPSRVWRILVELASLVQLSVMATALALYYIIYCYMQMVYYALRSVLYFHNADGSMKLTIAVVTITAIVVAFNLVVKLERVLGISSARTIFVPSIPSNYLVGTDL